MTAVRDHVDCFVQLSSGPPVDDHVWLIDEDVAYAHPIVLLYYPPQLNQWTLDVGGAAPGVVISNPALTSPDDLHEAQQWVARFLTFNNASGVTFGSELSTWTITEWRLVAVGGQVGWMPLYDLSDLTGLPFPVRSPATGTRANPLVDNQLRALHDRGASPMHPLGTELLRATAKDIDEVTFLLAQNLVDLPYARWLVPDTQVRLWVLADYLAIHVKHAITSGYGHVDIVREYDPSPLARDRVKGVTGAAVWLYHDDGHLNRIPDHRRRLRRACRQYSDRFEQLDTARSRHHPTTPHHDLAAFAVAGHRRRQHLGSLLLRAHLTLLDTGHVGAAAVTASRPARSFLRRHGFTPIPTPPTPARVPARRGQPRARLVSLRRPGTGAGHR